jgi:biotin carboxylase
VAVVTDANPAAPAMALADEPTVLDIYDAQGHARLVERLSDHYNVRGVFAEGADVEYSVAVAAASAGLPGISVEAALNTKNKARMRACFDRAGLPNPAWTEIATTQDAAEAAKSIGYPLMAKAVDNCASRGTNRVDAAGQLGAAVELAKENSTTRTALLEACYSGEEQSVEIIFDETGKRHDLNIVDRPFNRSGGFAIELGHVNPTRLDSRSQKQLFDLAARAAAATGVNFGVFKADTMWTEDGPRLLEVTARLSGGFDCQYTTPLASGRNFIRAAMRLAIGLPLDLADLRRQWDRCAVAWVAFPEPGRVLSISGVDDALALPGVEHVFLRVAPGETIQPYQDCGTRPAFVIAVGDDYDGAMARARAGVAAIRFETSAG